MKSGSVNQEAGLVQTTTFYEKVATGKLSFYLIVLWLKWYVTQSLIEIHERARKGKITVERGKEELIAYMHWRAGEKTLKAYNHFFQPANHATVQNSVFKKLRGTETKNPQTAHQRKMKQANIRPSPSAQNVPSQVMEQPQDGAELYAFLIGTGGYSDDLIADLIATD